MKSYMSIGERSYFNGERYTCVEVPKSVPFLIKCVLCEVPRSVCPFVRCFEYERDDHKRVVFVRSVVKFRKKIIKLQKNANRRLPATNKLHQ